MLLKSNWIFCLIFEIIFGNYFLMISNKFEEHLWLYFVFFLNHPPICEEIYCYASSYRHSNNLNATLSSSCWKVFMSFSYLTLKREIILFAPNDEKIHSFEIYSANFICMIFYGIFHFTYSMKLLPSVFKTFPFQNVFVFLMKYFYILRHKENHPKV